MRHSLTDSFVSSFRSIVLPREHGSWSLALEPVALGLLVAPSRAGACLALAACAGFVARRPLKLALTLPTTDPRHPTALRWLTLLTLLAALALAAVLTLAILRNTQNPPASVSSLRTVPISGRFSVANLRITQNWGVAALWPLALVVPFGAAFLAFDRRGEMRAAEAEICGSLAFALLPATFATLAGWSTAPALALAAVMITRSVPTILTVRTALRRAKGQRAVTWPALSAALAGVVVLTALQRAGLVPLAAVACALGFAARSAWLLSPATPAWSARRIGTMEAALGLAFLATLTVAYWLA